MKQITLLLLFSLALLLSWADITEYYSFNSTTGAWNEITGTSITSILDDDVLSEAIPIGFEFPYGTSVFTTVKASSNGWIGLGSSHTSNSMGNNLASTSIIPVIAPLWDDTSLSYGNCQYLLTGTQPNRVFTVQYTDLRWRYSANNQFDFQARLHETGKIEIIYGPADGNPVSPSASIGINMAPGGNGWFYSVTPGNPATASTTIANNSVNVFPALGTVYEFLPVEVWDNDLACLSVSGNANPTVGILSNYIVTVRNPGSLTQNAYDVKLYRGAGIEVSTSSGTPIGGNQNLTFTLPWTPSTAGADALYGKVLLAGDENTDNDQSAPFPVNVQPAGTLAVTIGAGNELARVPLDFYYRNSLFECLYFADEINLSGSLITAVEFYNNFSTSLPGKPTKIWLGTTTQNDLSGGWIPATQLTPVFDGVVDYPSGINPIHITLTTPFPYITGNLVLMAKRPMDTEYFAVADQFAAQTVGSTRSLRASDDNNDFDPANPPANSTLSGLFPKTTLYFSTQGFGTLSGTIFGPGAVPMSGALVSVSGTNYNFTTAGDGAYNFPALPVGQHLVMVTKHGYLDSGQFVTIIEDQTVTQNFTLDSLPTVSLSGRIVGSDMPDVGINGANFQLTGYETYNVTTGVGGYFSIPAVFAEQSYQYSATAAGYQGATGEITVGLEDVNLGTIVLSEITLPPVNIVASEAPDLLSALVTWTAPGTFLGEWIHYDSGENGTSVGTGGQVDFTVAIRFPASAMAAYSGASVQAVKVWPASEGNFSVRVWTGGNADAPGTLQADQTFIADLNVYNTVLLSTPVLITGAEELWLGMRCQVNGGYPAGCDSGPATDGLGNLIYFQNTWSTLLELAPTLDFNWNIQAYVGSAAPTPSDLTALDGDRALLGYKLWRLLPGEESNSDAWTLLTPETIAATEYSDTGWPSLAPATYKFAVKAAYTNGILSDAAFSNNLEKGMMGVLSGTVTDWGTGLPLAGALVQAGTYSTNTDAAGTYSFYIHQDTYTVTCSKAGYTTFVLPALWVPGSQTTTLDIQLQETTLPAFGVTATEAPNQGSVDLDWSAPSTPAAAFEDGFEDYADFALDFPPWTNVDLDGSNTYGLTNSNYPNESAPQSFIIMNPSAANPPITNMPTHGGAKMAACAAATNPPNNDWLISPLLVPSPNTEFSFWARSWTANYGLERIQVGISTVSANPADFTIISGPGYLSMPVAWTEYSYSLGSYAGQQIYIGIHCVSNDAWYLFVDDFYFGDPAKAKAYGEIALSSEPLPEHRQIPFTTAPRITPEASNTQSGNDRALTGYQVWRLPSGGESDPAAWALLTDAAVPETNLTDSTWGLAAPGNYRWAVKSVYTGGLTGSAAFSNILTRGAFTDLAALLIDGNLTPAMGVPTQYAVLVRNLGNTPIPGSAYTVHLMNGPVILTTLPGIDLAAGESHTFYLDWTPDAMGTIVLHGAVTPLADAVSANNETAGISVEVQDPNVPFELSSFTAVATVQGGVRLQWISQSETGLQGYRVYRGDTSELSGSVGISILIPATNTSTQAEYEFLDAELATGTYYYWLEGVDYNSSDYYGPVSVTLNPEITPVLPTVSSMNNAYPNPFKSAAGTTIELAVKAGESGQISIYNLHGQIVRSYNIGAGSHQLKWDGRDSRGRVCGSGIYFYRLTTPSLNQTRKLVLAN